MSASYPGAVKTFASRAAGQTIDASHVNDLQDEVNAIESGILNGTAPLSVSNASATTLSVSGGSTVNALTVNGVLTLAARPVTPPPEMAFVYRASTFAFGSSLAVGLFWDGEEYVSNSSMHSTSANADRLIPQSTGMYCITAQVTYSNPSTTIGTVDLSVVDSSGAQIGSNRNTQSSNLNVLTHQVVGYKHFDALGGFVRAQIALASYGSTLSLSSGVGTTWMTLVKL
jgi:hypothetical protein